MKFLREVRHAVIEPEIHRELLPGGVLFLAEPVDAVPSLALGLWFRSGSRHERPDEAGLAHFIEHMVFKGSKRHSAFQLAQRMEALGGQIDAFTTKETTCYYARVFEGHHRQAIDVLAELVGEPRFEAEMVERERQVVEEEIQSYDDNPEEKVQDLAAELVYGAEHPLGRPILGTEKSLAAIGSRALRRFHRTHYTRPNLIVTAAGKFDLARLREEIVARIKLPGSAPSVTRLRIPKRAAAERHEERELQQTSLCLVRSGPSARDPGRHAHAVLNTILGAGMSSRLFQRIREDEGLAYSVYSFSDPFRESGMFGVILGCHPNKLERAFRLVCRELAKIKRDGIKRWELESARAQLLTGLFLSCESMYERISRLAHNELHFGRQLPLADGVDGIARVGEAEVRAAAAELLEPGAFSLVTLGPAGKRPKLADLDF